MQRRSQIHPVILAVPESSRQLKGKPKVELLSRLARIALGHSARLSDLAMGQLEKADNGAPLPSQGIHWSLTHKERYVAAVAAAHPIGIDIEKLRCVSRGLYQRIAGRFEWELSPEAGLKLFFRYWTAKEAVLKAVGTGIAGLSRCKIRRILDDTRLELTYDDALWRVTQYWIEDRHIVAVTTDNVETHWHLLDENESERI